MCFECRHEEQDRRECRITIHRPAEVVVRQYADAEAARRSARPGDLVMPARGGVAWVVSASPIMPPRP